MTTRGRPRGAEAAPEFFTTGMLSIKRTTEYVRLVFYSQGMTVSVVLTPGAYEDMVDRLMPREPRYLN